MSLVHRVAEPATTTYDDVAQAGAAAVIRGYSTSFGWATRLLAEPVRTDIRNTYALVRLADEIVDGPSRDEDDVRTRAVLDALEADTLDAVRTGYSTNLVVHAFALTARRCGIGTELIRPFFASMRSDVSVTRHSSATFDVYVYGSAEVVGLMCLRTFLQLEDPAVREARYEDLAPGARRLGAGFQKVNFLRDLAADHDGLGRFYFPGLELDQLDDAVRDRLLDEIDADLAAGAKAAGALPSSSRLAVRLAHDLFAELSRRLRRTPAAELKRQRIRVPDPAKARILVAAVFREALSTGPDRP